MKLTRRRLFGALAGAAAALVGWKVKPASERSMTALLLTQPRPFTPVMTFAQPVVDMAVIGGDLFVTTERELWVLSRDGTRTQMARWGA